MTQKMPFLEGGRKGGSKEGRKEASPKETSPKDTKHKGRGRLRNLDSAYFGELVTPHKLYSQKNKMLFGQGLGINRLFLKLNKEHI